MQILVRQFLIHPEALVSLIGKVRGNYPFYQFLVLPGVVVNFYVVQLFEIGPIDRCMELSVSIEFVHYGSVIGVLRLEFKAINFICLMVRFLISICFFLFFSNKKKKSYFR